MALSDEQLNLIRRLVFNYKNVPHLAAAARDLLAEVERLRVRNAELEGVLRMCDESDETFHHCPVCGCSGGHAPECALDAALRGEEDT